MAGKLISKLFGIPSFGVECCKMDYLHAVDLGVAADFMGSLFDYVTMTKIAGSTKRARCAALFKEIQAFYKANNTQSRLPKLVSTMIRAEVQGKLKSPKLRAKAGEARELIPCQLLIAQKFCDVDSTVEATMVQASQQLYNLYDCLSARQWSTVHFLEAAQRFLLLFAALEAHFEQDKLFRVKPKAHQLIELARAGTNPVFTWNYRDESFGHYLSEMAQRRGGKFSMKAVSSSVLYRFLAANQIPRL